MRADKTGIPEGGTSWGDLQVEFESFPAGLDTAPLLQGLPGNACPCPHWGYVFKGRFLIRYADHEEIVTAGDAFYMAPGPRARVPGGHRDVRAQPSRGAQNCPRGGQRQRRPPRRAAVGTAMNGRIDSGLAAGALASGLARTSRP